MKQRIITGFVLFAIILPLLIVEDLFPIFQIVMLILCVVASKEMIGMYDKEKKIPTGIKGVIMVSSALIYMSTLTEWDNSKFADGNAVADKVLTLINLKIGFLPMLLLVLIVLFTLMIFVKGFDGGDIGKSLLAILYSGVCFGALTILRFVGLRFIIYLFMITMLTDVFAYFGGYLFGKHKMAPVTSPKKTWEGAIIGSFVAVSIATLFAFFYDNCYTLVFGEAEYVPTTLFEGSGVFLNNTFKNFTFANIHPVGKFFIIFGISLLISIAGQIGDLVASKLKRKYGIKDYGNIFPGHGGVLDRFDSAIFAALLLLLLFVIL